MILLNASKITARSSGSLRDLQMNSTEFIERTTFSTNITTIFQKQAGKSEHRSGPKTNREFRLNYAQLE
jgi:hypothetical protein